MPSSFHSIAFEQLIDLVEGRLAAEAEVALRARIATQPEAAAELAWLERTIGLMRSDTMEDAPTHVIARALRLMRPQRPPEAPGTLRRLLATLNFDSQQMPLAAGLRASQSGMRQLLFSAEDRVLDVRITSSGTQWIVSGQVLGPDATGQIELSGAAGAFQAELNALSEFVLPAVPDGSYQLTLRQGTVEVVVPGLELGVSLR